MKKTLTLKFILRSPERAESPVYLRITYNRVRAVFATGVIIQTSDWDDSSERLKKGKESNNRLAAIERDIRELFDKLRHQDKPISAQILRDIHVGKAPVEQMLLEYFNKHIDFLESLPRREFAATTVAKYKTSLKHIVGFLASKKLRDLPLSKVDYRFVCDMDHYLITFRNYRSGGTLERNTVNKIHRQLKAVLHKAIKEDFLEKSPYRNFPLRDARTKRDFLTDEELKRLREHDLGFNRSLQRVRDIYLFSVYTGLRRCLKLCFTDFSSHQPDHRPVDKRLGVSGIDLVIFG